MSTTVVRTADSWWHVSPDGGARAIPTSADTTAELLADRDAVGAAARMPASVQVGDLDLVSPVTAPCRVMAQLANYVSHVRESGMNPETVPLTFFRKASGSITGPEGDVVRPRHVRLLDYEVEIGLVIGRTLPVGTTVTEANVADYVAGLVLTNDVSARDVQLPKTQFYEAKSYPTFTPVGPRLVLLDSGDFAPFRDLRLRLQVSGEPRQDSTVADMIHQPAQALATLAGFQRLDPGDLVLTGTPGGTALRAPPKPVELIGGLLPPAVKWKIFFARQAKNRKYLRDGDLLELHAGTPDGVLDLGTQRCRVRDGTGPAEVAAAGVEAAGSPAAY
jgi:2-keto-4-pentenoate hydratase/2-oxohepta-3-ene-1,7-dioic acid hydratase in catechol pathway